MSDKGQSACPCLERFWDPFLKIVVRVTAIGMALAALTARSAGVLSFPSAGLILTFDPNGDPTNGFSTISVGASLTNITTPAQLDAAVQLLSPSSITNFL